MQDGEWMSLMARINGMSNQFTKTDWKIVHFINTHVNDFLQSNAQEIAEATGTSDASIIRFTQKVGFSGLNEFKFALQQDTLKREVVSQKQDENILLQDNKTLIEMLFNSIPSDTINKVSKKMLKSKRIFVLGLGINKYVAEILAFKFSLLGLHINTITNHDSLNVIKKLSTPDDLFLIITFSGDREFLADAMGELVTNGSCLVLISNHKKSLCAAYADILLLIPKTDMLSSSYLISREISLICIGDMIFQYIIQSDDASFLTFKETVSYVDKD